MYSQKRSPSIADTFKCDRIFRLTDSCESCNLFSNGGIIVFKVNIFSFRRSGNFIRFVLDYLVSLLDELERRDSYKCIDKFLSTTIYPQKEFVPHGMYFSINRTDKSGGYIRVDIDCLTMCEDKCEECEKATKRPVGHTCYPVSACVSLEGCGIICQDIKERLHDTILLNDIFYISPKNVEFL